MELSRDISAVVTGGASGLGAATARELAGSGVKVAILDLDQDRGRAVASDIDGGFHRCDVTSAEDVREALSAARAANGQERVTVNCAGIAIGKRTVRRDRKTGELRAHDLESFTKVIQINLIGTFNVMASSAAGMLSLDPVTGDGGRGVIVNTSSVAARDGQVGQVAYAASKGGIAAMTLPAARDLSRDGVRVMTILPGLFETPMFDGMPEEVKGSLGASVPFPSRLGEPAEYARLVRHICENEMLNGECIRLDGAIRLAPS